MALKMASTSARASTRPLWSPSDRSKATKWMFRANLSFCHQYIQKPTLETHRIPVKITKFCLVQSPKWRLLHLRKLTRNLTESLVNNKISLKIQIQITGNQRTWQTTPSSSRSCSPSPRTCSRTKSRPKRISKTKLRTPTCARSEVRAHPDFLCPYLYLVR